MYMILDMATESWHLIAPKHWPVLSGQTSSRRCVSILAYSLAFSIHRRSYLPLARCLIPPLVIFVAKYLLSIQGLILRAAPDSFWEVLPLANTWLVFYLPWIVVSNRPIIASSILWCDCYSNLEPLCAFPPLVLFNSPVISVMVIHLRSLKRGLFSRLDFSLLVGLLNINGCSVIVSSW